MKKYLLGLALVSCLVFGIVYAYSSSITVLTGVATAPEVVHSVVFPDVAINLGTKVSGVKSQNVELVVRNNGNVSETVTASVLSFSGVTVNSIKFNTSGSDTTEVLPNGQQVIVNVNYDVDLLAPGTPNTPIELQIKFEVL